MNLKTIQDSTLIDKTLELVREERERLIVLLNHLREIEARRLFSAIGYKSLFDFCVRHLGYSEDQSYRRIAAMRILREIPELVPKISSGEINLSHIGVAQSFFKQELKATKCAIPKVKKLEIFELISSKPIREAEKMILSISSSRVSLQADQIRLVSAEIVEFKFHGPERLQNKIKKLKGLLAHKSPSMNLAELFEHLCDLGLEKYSQVEAAKLVANKAPSSVEAVGFTTTPAAPRKRRVKSVCISHKAGQAISRAEIRRQVFIRADEKCENCRSQYALEVDHIIPRAFGGKDEANNLRLLCRSCNQRAAIAALGQKKMERYLENLKL